MKMMTQQGLFFECMQLAEEHIKAGNPNHDAPTYKALFAKTREWMQAGGYKSAGNDSSVHGEAESFILAVHAW